MQHRDAQSLVCEKTAAELCCKRSAFELIARTELLGYRRYDHYLILMADY